jgi:NADH:ubiquinone oxidoreductase subunit 6 (subunit J)
MSVYALPFEAISLILLAALVGAIVIGKAGK